MQHRIFYHLSFENRRGNMLTQLIRLEEAHRYLKINSETFQSDYLPKLTQIRLQCGSIYVDKKEVDNLLGHSKIKSQIFERLGG